MKSMETSVSSTSLPTSSSSSMQSSSSSSSSPSIDANITNNSTSNETTNACHSIQPPQTSETYILQNEPIQQNHLKNDIIYHNNNNNNVIFNHNNTSNNNFANNNIQYQMNQNFNQMNVMNYNLALKSIPIRPRALAPANIVVQQAYPGVTMQQPQQIWHQSQFIPNNGNNPNVQLAFNMQMPYKDMNGYMTHSVQGPQNFMAKVTPDNMAVARVLYQSNGSMEHSEHSTPALSQIIQATSSSTAPTSTKKHVPIKPKKESKKNSEKHANKNSNKDTCLSPLSDGDPDYRSNSNSNTDIPGTPVSSKKSGSSSKSKKSSNQSSNCTPQQESQMAQNNIFNKLISMGEEPERKLFLNQLFSYMKGTNSPITVMPVVCRQTVDLYRLYTIVKSYGGLETVCKLKQWRDVSSTMGFGGSTSAGFALKKTYCKYVFPYECKYDKNDIDPNPILASLDLLTKLESKKRHQAENASQQEDTSMSKEDSQSQDSFPELFNSLDDCNPIWEKPHGDPPMFFNHKDHSDMLPQSANIRNIPNENNKDLNRNMFPNLRIPIEHIKPNKFKRRKLYQKDFANVDISKVNLALASGLLAETTWALDYLSIISHDTSSLSVNIAKNPLLFETIINLFHKNMKTLIDSLNDGETNHSRDASNSTTLPHTTYNTFFKDNEVNTSHIVTRAQTIKEEQFYSKRFFDKKSSNCKTFEILKDEAIEKHEKIEKKCDEPTDKFSIEIPRKIIDQAIALESKKEVYEPEEDLFNSCSEDQLERAKLCICISNIFRNLSMSPWNEKEMATNLKFISLLSHYILLDHIHANKNQDNINEVSSHPHNKDLWWWSVVTNIRSNCIVTLSSIANHLNLSLLPGDICIELCDGLLHWAVCQSSEALDLHSGLNISLQRIVFETVSKLCISKHNTNYVLATPPFSRLVQLVNYATITIHNNESEIVKDILLGLLSRITEADVNLAQVLVLEGSGTLILVGLIENYITSNVFQEQNKSFLDLNVLESLPRSSSYTACKAAEILSYLAKIPENKKHLSRFSKHFLDIVTSNLYDDTLTGLISDIIAAIC